jgi:hypothetical protein
VCEEWTALQGGAYMVAAKLAFFLIKKMKRAVKKSQCTRQSQENQKKTRTTFSDWHFPGAR